MPLAVQALLPVLSLAIGAALVAFRPRRPENGWIAAGVTAVAAAITLIELVRLAPGERVDVPYLTSFPYADLAIRVDALSLSFAMLALGTAAVLMLSRVLGRGDRRDPWLSWLLTTGAVLTVLQAHNLLLIYILLQALTLAWSGTLDEGAPRRRRLRLAIMIADIGLLLAAAGAIQSVGTAAFSGVPSDTFGPAAFLLVLLPIVARLVALGWPTRGSPAPVDFEPAVVWAAPAAYLLVRLIAVMGGHLPGRPSQLLLFTAGLLMAAGAAYWASSEARSDRSPTVLLIGHAGLALALIASGSPLLLIASVWLWLLLIPLAGLCSLRLPPESAANAVRVASLALLPGTTGFVGIWIGESGLRSTGQLVALILVGLVVIAIALAALNRLRSVDRVTIDLPLVWSLGLLLVGAFPAVMLGLVVVPTAQTVRSIPGGSVVLGPLGFSVAGTPWPALLITLLVTGGGALLLWARRIQPRQPALLPRPPWPDRPAPAFPTLPLRWVRRVGWCAFLAVALLAVLRP